MKEKGIKTKFKIRHHWFSPLSQGLEDKKLKSVQVNYY